MLHKNPSSLLAFLYEWQDIFSGGPVLLQYRLHFSDEVFTKNISALEKKNFKCFNEALGFISIS